MENSRLLLLLLLFLLLLEPLLPARNKNDESRGVCRKIKQIHGCEQSTFFTFGWEGERHHGLGVERLSCSSLDRQVQTRPLCM